MKKLTYFEAVNEAIAEETERDPAVFVIGSGLGKGHEGMLDATLKKYETSRIINMPPSANAVVQVAYGMALTGAKPVACLDKKGVLDALSFITNRIATSDFMLGGQFDASMVIRTRTGYDKNVSPQQNAAFEGILASVPGLCVVCPSNAADAKALMKSALRSKSPVVFLEDKELYESKSDIMETLDSAAPLGKAEILREGSDLTVITYGRACVMCLEAAVLAADSGISCEVIDLKTLNPIDEEMIINSVKKTGKALIVHEARKAGGVGEHIASLIASSEAFDFLEAPVSFVCAADMPVGFSAELYDAAVISTQDVLGSIYEMCEAEE